MTEAVQVAHRPVRVLFHLFRVHCQNASDELKRDSEGGASCTSVQAPASAKGRCAKWNDGYAEELSVTAARRNSLMGRRMTVDMMGTGF